MESLEQSGDDMNTNVNTFVNTETIFYSEADSPLGQLLYVASEHGLRGIYFEQHKHFRGKGVWTNAPEHPVLQQAMREMQEFFDGKREQFDVPLDLQGTPFQQAVWQALMRIPFGDTISYGEHAQRVGKPDAARAVGAAIGRNPVSIIVPCHRVVAGNGNITGYAGGLERKRALLAFETRQQRFPS
jgi:methylated-DNA-[protein]-cysteine S-methyltransferase